MNRKDLEKNILKVKNNTLFTSDLLYKDAIYEIEEAFKKKPFRIAVVGQFSSGKSTFINALIGKDILLHATEETTAALTSIHNVAQNDRMWHCCDITFNDGKSEHLKDDESLLDYTTTKSKIYSYLLTVFKISLIFKPE